MRSRTLPLAALALATLTSACGATAQPAKTRTSRVAAPAVAPPRAGKLHVDRPHVTQPHAAVVLAYSRCMRAHGIRNFPNPVNGHILLTPSSGIDMSSAKFVAAAKACARYGPAAPKAPSGVPSFASWLGARARAGQFSGTVLIARAGRVALDRGYGLADRTGAVANSAQTRFCIASIGKLFTAVAVGQLAEHGELRLGAPVGAYVPGLPTDIARITIGQLLDMTGGLGNVVLARANPPRALAQMVALIAHEHPQAPPGRRFLYSNDGYILLGDVVERVSGVSYLAYLRAHIFAPAGMQDVGYSAYVPRRVADMAHGYALLGSRLRDIGGRLQIANPSGGAYATATDLYRFAQALLHDRLLSRAMTALMLKPRVASPQPGGPKVDAYTYGFGYEKLDGVSFVGHNGGTPGYAGQIDIYPRSGDVAVVLTNQDDTLIPAIQRSEQLLT
jgi:CubicO group peptidase (beta-lactamase class C family)